MTPQERKVMELAIEALEKHKAYGTTYPADHEAITAIKEALAQPERVWVEGYGENASGYVNSQPEPVTKGQWWAKELEGFWGSANYVVTLDTRRAAKTALTIIFNTTPPQPKEPEQEPETKPCRSPYCECERGNCTRSNFHDARHEPMACVYCGQLVIKEQR